MNYRTPEEIRAKFEQLRLVCDRRGLGLLDELESLALRDNALLAMQHRIEVLQEEIIRGFEPVADVIPFPLHSVRA